MLTIAPTKTFIAIDRVSLAARIEHIETKTVPDLMEHALRHREVTEPARMVASKLSDAASRLRVGLELGASDQDLNDDYEALEIYTDAAAHWSKATERWPTAKSEVVDEIDEG